jgi:hypothetical protein
MSLVLELRARCGAVVRLIEVQQRAARCEEAKICKLSSTYSGTDASSTETASYRVLRQQLSVYDTYREIITKFKGCGAPMTPPAQPKNAQPALMDRRFLLRLAESQPPNGCSHVATVQNVKSREMGRRTVCGGVRKEVTGFGRVLYSHRSKLLLAKLGISGSTPSASVWGLIPNCPTVANPPVNVRPHTVLSSCNCIVRKWAMQALSPKHAAYSVAWLNNRHY